MRIRPNLIAAAIALFAVGAQAQALPTPARPATEPAASVFVYERLGATPSIDVQRLAQIRKLRMAQAARSAPANAPVAPAAPARAADPAAAR